MFDRIIAESEPVVFANKVFMWWDGIVNLSWVESGQGVKSSEFGLACQAARSKSTRHIRAVPRNKVLISS